MSINPLPLGSGTGARVLAQPCAIAHLAPSDR